MKIKDGFILRTVGDSYVVVAIGKTASKFNGMIALNETGKDMFEIMSKGDFTRDSVFEELSKIYYCSDKERVLAQVDKFITELIKAKVIDE